MIVARGDRLAVAAVLLLLSLLSWVVTVQQSDGMGWGLVTMSMTMGRPFSAGNAALYIALWGVMMAAMMFPALVPMATLFATVSRRKRSDGQDFAPAWLFVAGYAGLWTLTGAAAYAGDLAIQALPELVPALAARGKFIGGATLVAAGAYQLTPLKDLCLSKCRSPLGFLLNHWREGRRGALQMGFHHGAYCLGCCWGLMAVLFVVGTMNLLWMALLSAVILLEKVLGGGVALSKLVGVLLVGAGVAMIAAPALWTAA